MADRYVGGLRVAAPEPTLHLAKITREVAKTFWGDTAESTLATINDAFKPGGSYSCGLRQPQSSNHGLAKTLTDAWCTARATLYNLYEQ